MNQAMTTSSARVPPVRFLDAAARSELGGEGVLVLRIERLGPSSRGRLSDVIDEAMERELAARGAPSPGALSTLDADAALSDQLFRARQIGVRRVCVALGPMRPVSSPAGTIEAEDTATLLFWARATQDRPVELVLDATDELTGGFVAPVALKEVLGRAGRPLEREAARAVPDESALAPPDITPQQPVRCRDVHSAIDRHTVGIGPLDDDGNWRAWMLALTAAKGPQPLSAFERIFVQSYLPLCEAIERGLGDSRAAHARDEFRTSFARMYADACPTFAATGKRPKMVLDAPVVGARLGKLHGARTVQLLLVSSMRHDVASQVKSALETTLAGTARIADELILWSALPTTTSRQLDCLSRGPDALRQSVVADREVEPEAVRGRTAESVRRVKIGSRDVYKLDACEVRVREAAGGALAAIPSAASTVAEVIARHAATLSARTLLLVFGDHGFAIDPSGHARCGGASPEEVLAPAFALLVGDTH